MRCAGNVLPLLPAEHGLVYVSGKHTYAYNCIGGLSVLNIFSEEE